jgi:hypothetical protein
MISSHIHADVLAHLSKLKDSGETSVPLNFFFNSEDKNSFVSIEPIISSLKSIDAININFHFDGNKTLTLSTSDDSMLFNFTVEF